MTAGAADMGLGLARKRKRKYKSYLPAAARWQEFVLLALMGLTPVVGVWALGGRTFWTMAPMILATLVGGLFFISRFLISSYRTQVVVPPGGYLLLVFLAYLGLILPFSQIPHQATLETFRFISYALAFWAWVNVLRPGKRWQWMLFLMMISVSIMSAYALIQEGQGTRHVLFMERPDDYGMRASGSYTCPNHFANLLAMMIPVCIGVVGAGTSGLALRLVAGYTALISLPALYLTQSRSGWLALMVGSVVFFIAASLRRGFKRFVLALILVPLLAGGAGWVAWKTSPAIQKRVNQAMAGDIRVVIWKDSIEIVKDYPWIGSGLGSYFWMYPHYRKHVVANRDPQNAHNDYLQYAGEFGLIGLALMGLVVLLLAARAVRVILKDRDPASHLFMAGMLGMIVGTLAHTFFDFNFHCFANAHVYLLLIGIMLAAAGGDAVDRRVAVSGAWGRRLGGLLFVLVLLASLFYGRALVSHVYVALADRAHEDLRYDEAQARYETAITWAPENWQAHIGKAHLLRARSFWMRDPVRRAEWIAESRLHYERALQGNPWEADVLYGLSTLALFEGDGENALALRRKIVEMVPRHVYYLNELGDLLRYLGRYEEALAVFRESKSVEPDNRTADLHIQWLQRELARPK
jgi:O-antigen ligase